MSVYTQECQREEYPELAVICNHAFFGGAKTQPPALTAPAPIHTLSIDEYRGHADEYTGSARSALIASQEFALVAVLNPTDAPSCKTSEPHAPHPACFTMEDDGQSQGANKNSAFAAMILASLNGPAIPS